MNAAVDLTGQLLNTRRVDKVEFDCTLLNADEAVLATPGGEREPRDGAHGGGWRVGFFACVSRVAAMCVGLRGAR